MNVSVVIPTWDGWPLLRENLPSVLAACRRYGAAEVVVSDDGSTDGTVDALARDFPDVSVIRRPRNGGFAAAANDGVRAGQGAVAICLNNDVRPEADFLGPLVETLERDPSLFAAAPCMISDGFGGDEARTYGVFQRGIVDLVFPDREAVVRNGRAPSAILYACGGAAAFRKDRFLALGGFDPIFHPFYWEDVDLGWRAHRRGWGSLHVPASVVHHQGGATIGVRFPSREVKITYERNRLLFLWSNLLDAGLWRSHLAWLGPRIASSLVRGTPFAPGLLRARRLLEPVRRRRRSERSSAVVPDREILARCTPG